MEEGTILVYCCPSIVPSLWPPSPSPPFLMYSTSSPLPPFLMYSICRQCVTPWCVTVGGGWCWGDVELCCRQHSAGVLHSDFSDQIQNLQNYYTMPPQTKMTSKDDIKGFTLKFIRLWKGHMADWDSTWQIWRQVKWLIWKPHGGFEERPLGGFENPCAGFKTARGSLVSNDLSSLLFDICGFLWIIL